MQTQQLERTFSFSENNHSISLADPSSLMTPKEVLHFYATTYPALTTARIEGPAVVKDRIVYRFIPTIGTKG